MEAEQRQPFSRTMRIPGQNIEAEIYHQVRIANLKEKYGHLFGGVHINYILYFFIPLLIFACLYSYHMAVSTKQQKPFPHATITNTACHYPQDIVFRFLMLPAGSFIILLYFIVFRWLKLQKERTQFPYGTEQWLYKYAIASVVGFYCAIGTIDGAGYPELHDFGAIFFFIVLYIVAGTISIVMREMHNWDPTIIARKSIVSKLLIFGYISGVAVYCGVGGIIENIPSNDDDIYVVIIEWNLTLMGLVWLLTFVMDFSSIFVTLRGDMASTVKRVSLESSGI